ncbi:MOSC N-terminal beta barrel domain-containing protein [Plectosphaerella plurivora]|uniref:Molybdenum cofactor sulfurase n=1 Tax=Plectosphaerella plurivora TaxID=936078 RepID=A0A9P9AAH9_9PEZI|nr:MOSC N-terminal beta barrel domain-containing protein [Plectosphaerella plurivora]
MPRSSYNSRVEEFREVEYPMLSGSVYLDHAGTTLYSKSLMDRFSKDMMSNLLANPHSGSSPSQYTTSKIEDVRLRLLTLFNADPDEFDLVFVANTTAAVKLVMEAFRGMPGGFWYAYHQACHTSLVGVREEARDSVCVDNDKVQLWIEGNGPFSEAATDDAPTLFAYSAQSHLDGRRYPMHSAGTSSNPVYTLVDAASLVATSPLDLGDAKSAPDFTVLSLYKMFGFPDLGALIVRRQAEGVFQNRRYFGGGTVDMVVSGKERWHAFKTQFLHERLEDGTLPFHSILALDAAMDTHFTLFVSMAQISSHTAFLRHRMHQGLERLRHGNGTAVCAIYGQPGEDSDLGEGPVVSFNLRNAQGAWVSLNEFEKLTILKNFHVRTGGVCSPGGIAAALALEPWEMRRNFSAGFRCGADQDTIAGKPTGVIRVSLGAMSTKSDVDQFVAFIEEFYLESQPQAVAPRPSPTMASSGFRVEAMTVYPIKSCAGFSVPKGTPWEIKPEGLGWDREWCLLHRGTGQALSQKRHPKMALLRPSLDFVQGVLRVSYTGPTTSVSQITVPLSSIPTDQHTSSQRTSRVCGDEIVPQTYTDYAITDFFTAALGVPCMLARFPAGGQGRSMRHSKAQFLRHQKPSKPSPTNTLPGSFPDLPSPPDSDSEQQQRSKILLANESPILLVSTASLDALNRDISVRGGGNPVAQAAFRGNIVVGPVPGSERENLAYIEDTWAALRIGTQSFKPMGSCRRCQMVCIDQETGERRQEPFSTLSKTRRIEGKVYFGIHMRHDPPAEVVTREAQYPTVCIGDAVEVDSSFGDS